MKRSTVYFRGGDIYVLASAKNAFGIFQASEPFFKLPSSSSPQEIGQRVLDALAAYREGVPGKTYVRGVKQPPDPFLTFAGFKSWNAFEKGGRHFSISENGSELQITPSIPAPEGGHLHQPNKALHVPAHAEQIGRALLEQLKVQSG